MSSLTFPNLPGMMVEFDDASTYRTTVMEAVSGREQRVSWGATRRHTYNVRISVLREDHSAPNEAGIGGQNWASYSEVNVVKYFWNTHRGDWDTFYFRAPEPGGTVTRTVRFVNGTFVMRRIVPVATGKARWSCEFQLITDPVST